MGQGHEFNKHDNSKEEGQGHSGVNVKYQSLVNVTEMKLGKFFLMFSLREGGQ